MKLNDKQLETVSGAILTSFINLHFLHEAKNLGVFKQKAKLNLNRTMQDLMFIEKQLFDKLDSIDDSETADKLIANKMEFVDWVLNKFSYYEFLKVQEVCAAYSIDKEKLTKVSDEILIKNGAKK